MLQNNEKCVLSELSSRADESIIFSTRGPKGTFFGSPLEPLGLPGGSLGVPWGPLEFPSGSFGFASGVLLMKKIEQIVNSVFYQN